MHGRRQSPRLEERATQRPSSSRQLKKKLARARKAQWHQADAEEWQAGHRWLLECIYIYIYIYL